MIQMKKMAVAVALAAASISGAQALSTGDVLFTGVASNNSSLTQFSFVTFADLAEGTVISFTDTNFKQNGASSPFGFVGSTPPGFPIVSGTPESYIQWTVGAGGVAAGTSVGITFNSNNASSAVATLGGTTMTGSTLNTSGFSGTADTLWAFVAGSSYNSVGTMLSNLTTYASGSGDNLPATITNAGLATGSTSINPSTVVSPVKYAYYNGATSFASWADAQAAVANVANWSVSSTAAAAALPLSNLTVAAVPEASTYAMLLAGLGMIGLMARRRSA